MRFIFFYCSATVCNVYDQKYQATLCVVLILVTEGLVCKNSHSTADELKKKIQRGEKRNNRVNKST